MFIKGPYRFQITAPGTGVQAPALVISSFVKDSDDQKVSHDFTGKFSDHMILIENDGTGAVDYVTEVMVMGRWQRLAVNLSTASSTDDLMRLSPMSVIVPAATGIQISAEALGRHVEAIRLTPSGTGKPAANVNVWFQSRISEFGKP